MSDIKQTRVNEDFLIILRTIVTFLGNHSFKNTLQILNKEIVELGLKDFVLEGFNFSPEVALQNASESNLRVLSNVSNNSKKSENKSKTSRDNSSKMTVKERAVISQPKNGSNKLNDDGTDDELAALCNESDEFTPIQTDVDCQLSAVTADVKLKKVRNEESESHSQDSSSSVSDTLSLIQNLRAPQNTPNSYAINNSATFIKDRASKQEQVDLSFSESDTRDTQVSSIGEDSSLCQYENLKERFLKLQDEHRRLMEITAKLTVAFQRNIKGQTENMNIILNNCREICPELFCSRNPNRNTNCFTLTKEEFSQYITQEFMDFRRQDSTGSSNFSTDTFDETATTDMKSLPVEEMPADIPSHFQLDFQKLKTDLRNGDTNTKLALLQALRWRLTRNPAYIRTEVMASYERFDLLDIRNCSHRNASATPKTKFLDSFYCPKKTPDILQDSMARLINAIASMKTGRDYLTRQSILMNFLLSILLGTHNLKPKLESKTRDLTIATMQKMSLRYWQRVIMINAGVVRFLVKFLSDNYKKLSSYCLEYSTALLMNLWLHVDAREKSRSIVKDIVKLLATLLDIKYENCLPYVNGSLYSLLPDPNFHKVAKDVKLGQIIEYRIPTAEADMQEQLRCILKIYHDPVNWQPMCDCDLGNEIENEIDLFEPESDENDQFFTNGLSGEQLLYNYRLLFPLNGSQVCSTTLILRPISPCFTKRTAFSVSPMSPYAKDDNNYILRDSLLSIQYQHLKDFLINKLAEDTPYKEIYIQNKNEIIVKDAGSPSKSNGKVKQENVTNVNGHKDGNLNNLSKANDVSNQPKAKNVQTEQKKADKLQTHQQKYEKKDESKLNTANDNKTKKEFGTRYNSYKIDNNKDKNNNKKNEIKKSGKEYCEETQQFYHKPTKNAIFESETKSELTVPSFTKQQVYDKKNISLPNTPFYATETAELVQKSCSATADVEALSEALNVHPAHLHPNCYRQNYKSACYCKPVSNQNADVAQNNKKINRYACCCYEKLKQSFEEEFNNENKIRNISPNKNRHGTCNISCKYTNICSTPIERNVQQNERDSGFGSRQLDEGDYDAVFESRPRILRTP